METEETERLPSKADLSPVVEAVAKDDDTGPLAGEPEMEWRQRCEYVAEEFTSLFTVDRLADSAKQLSSE
jgi:hypothetical protein